MKFSWGRRASTRPEAGSSLEEGEDSGDVSYSDTSHLPPRRPSNLSEKPSRRASTSHQVRISRSARRYGPLRWTLRRILIVGGICFLVALVIGVAVGVVVGKRKNPKARGYASANTGIVAIDDVQASLKREDGQVITKLYLYFADSDQHIQQALFTDQRWHGGPELQTIKLGENGIRPGSPIMALSYILNFTRPQLIWEVFWIDDKNFLQESSYTNGTGGWTAGQLGNGKFTASKATMTGLTACRSDQWYAGPNNNTAGIRLFYGSSDGGVQELIRPLSDLSAAWEKGQYFADASAEAGCECTNRGQSILNLWTISKDNTTVSGKPTKTLTHHWIDFNTTTSNTSHPAGQWTATNMSYPGLHPQSALSVITLVKNTTTTNDRLAHFQMSDGTIRELNVSGLAEGTYATDNYSDVVRYSDGANKPRVPTKLGSVVLETKVNGGQEVHVLYEVDPAKVPPKGTVGGTTGGFVGSITDAVRTLDSYNWDAEPIPIF